VIDKKMTLSSFNYLHWVFNQIIPVALYPNSKLYFI
jgi:hypothetical protein